MNRKEHLLVCLMEEASEVQQAASKMLRLGPYNHPPVDPGDMNNRQTLTQAIHDLSGIAGILMYYGIVDPSLDKGQERIKGFMVEYSKSLEASRALGTVSDSMEEYGTWDDGFGIHTVQVTLQSGDLRGSFTYRRKGNCRGLQLLDFDIAEHDPSMLDMSPGLDIKIGVSNSLEVNFLGSDDLWHMVGVNRRGFENMIVGIEIVDFKRGE